MMPFPVSDEVLDALEHALDGSLDVIDGEPVLVGAEYSIHDLLDFLAGVDKSNATRLDDDDDGTAVYLLHDPTYSLADVIRALIAEVRRLRVHDSVQPPDDAV